MNRHVFRCMFLAVLLTVQPSFPSLAVDPLDPGGKEATMESEIKRGSDAGQDCYINNSRIGSDGLNCIRAVITENRESDTATDAFLLGIYFTGWLSYKDYDDSGSREKLAKGRIGEVEYRYVVNTIRRYFKEYNEIQRKLHIDDQTLCEVTETVYDIVEEDIQEWNDRAAIDSNFFDVE